jgi:hypothetical protein
MLLNQDIEQDILKLNREINQAQYLKNVTSTGPTKNKQNKHHQLRRQEEEEVEVEEEENFIQKTNTSSSKHLQKWISPNSHEKPYQTQSYLTLCLSGALFILWFEKCNFLV